MFSKVVCCTWVKLRLQVGMGYLMKVTRLVLCGKDVLNPPSLELCYLEPFFGCSDFPHPSSCLNQSSQLLTISLIKYQYWPLHKGQFVKTFRKKKKLALISIFPSIKLFSLHYRTWHLFAAISTSFFPFFGVVNLEESNRQLVER